MNEKVLLLAYDAGIPVFNDLVARKLELFAHLIIEECIQSIEQSPDRYRRDYFANIVKDHWK